jgi:hypothetical protein
VSRLGLEALGHTEFVDLLRRAYKLDVPMAFGSDLDVEIPGHTRGELAAEAVENYVEAGIPPRAILNELERRRGTVIQRIPYLSRYFAGTALKAETSLPPFSIGFSSVGALSPRWTSSRTRHLNLEEVLPAKSERVRISGINGSEFPEPTHASSCPSYPNCDKPVVVAHISFSRLSAVDMVMQREK